jgi:hypothetical protein
LAIDGSLSRCAVPVGRNAVRPYTKTICKVSLHTCRDGNVWKVETAIRRELELHRLSHQFRDGLDDPDPSNSARNNSLPRSSPITRKMSKYISNFFAKANQNFNLGEKFKASYNPGSRTFPSKTNKNDADYQMRIDAGEMVGTRRNIVLQVNSQAKATPLKEWIRKNKTHGKLATAYFDTAAEDPQKEATRVAEELQRKAKENV